MKLRLTKVADSVKEAKQLEAEFRFKIDNELTVSKLTPLIYGQQYIDNLIGIMLELNMYISKSLIT